LRARTEWHFGGGASYCDGCARQGRPCARGEPGSDGELCPYVAHEPLTDAGWQAWDVLLRCSGQLRVTQSGILALDFAAIFAWASALGYDTIALADLLATAETALIQALHERENAQ
jgi:hypothetical protein